MINRFLFFVLLNTLLLFSCDDVIEKDLSNKQLTVISPANNIITSNSTITFWWEILEGAEYYQIQIVKPSFDSIIQLILDTSTTKDKILLSLSPGNYQWRLKAWNNNSHSLISTLSLTIDSTMDLSQQVILLSEPSAFDTTNQNSVSFSWYSLYNADDYRLEIWSPDFNSSNVFSVNTSSNSLIHDLPEGSYEWGVRGQNITSSTIYSKRFIYIDTTAPNDPVLITPADNAILNNGEILFSWSRGITSGSSISDSLYLYTDSTMTNIKLCQLLLSPNYNDSVGIGIYYWRVRSMDAAGNYSNYSNLRKLTIL